MSLIAAIRKIPNVGSTIGGYLGHTRPNLTPLFQRYARFEPRSIPTFQARSFSTSGTQAWKTLIKKDPSYLSVDNMKDLSPEKIQDLILLIDKEGIGVNEMSLSVKNFDKESMQQLLQAIGKWQKTLPCFSIVHFGVYSQSKYFFKPSLLHLKECELLLESKPYEFGFYEMQKIPLDNPRFVSELSNHLVKVGAKYPVYLILNDTALTKPPLHPKTGEPDLSPLTKIISAK
jgi:hypothetical protein